MNCPKYVAAAIAFQGYVGEIKVTCDKGECAQWDKTREHCVISTIGYSLSSISFDTMRIVKEMLTATQTAADLIKQYKELPGEEQELFKGLFTF